MWVAGVVRRSTFDKIVPSPRVHSTPSSRRYLEEFINTLETPAKLLEDFPVEPHRDRTGTFEKMYFSRNTSEAEPVMKGQRTSTNHNFINNARSPTQEDDLTSDRGGEHFRPTTHPAIIDQLAPNYSCYELNWLMTSPITQNTSCLQCSGQDLSAFVLQIVFV